MKEKDIEEFIEAFGSEVGDHESASTMLFMLDNHFCITFKGKQYYILEDSVLFTPEEYKIVKHLRCFTIDIYPSFNY